METMKTVFSLRLVTVDYYLEKPIKGMDVVYSEFRESPVRRLPVVRVFGTTPVGQKACVHLHGLFPYLLVQHEGGAGQLSAEYLQQLAVSIDQALQLSLGQASRSQQHVFKISAVEGIPFYGYHSALRMFLKIYLYNPGLVQRLAELLRSGAVMNQQMVPHETHIPFTLQVFIDYNLYGMSFLHLAAVKFRQPLLLGEETSSATPDVSEDSILLSGHGTPAQTHWTIDSIHSDQQLGPFVPRLTRCELEVDAVADDVINRFEKPSSGVANPGLAAIWNEEHQRRLCLGLSPLKRIPSQERHDIEDEDIEKQHKAELRGIIEQRWNAYERSLVSSQSATDVSELTSVPVTPAHCVGEQVESDKPTVDESTAAVVDESIVEEVTASQSWLAGSGALALQLLTDLGSVSQSGEKVLQQTTNLLVGDMQVSGEKDELAPVVQPSGLTETDDHTLMNSSQSLISSTLPVDDGAESSMGSTLPLNDSMGLSKADWLQVAEASRSSLPRCGGETVEQSSQTCVIKQSSSSGDLSADEHFSSFPVPTVPILSQSASSLPASGQPACLLQKQMLERSMLLVDSDDDEPLQEMQKLEKEESMLMSQAFWGEDEPPRQEAVPVPVKKHVSFGETPQREKTNDSDELFSSGTAMLASSAKSEAGSGYCSAGLSCSRQPVRSKARRVLGRSRSATSYKILTRQKKKEQTGVFGRKMLLQIRRLSLQQVKAIMESEKAHNPALVPGKDVCEDHVEEGDSELSLFDSQLSDEQTVGGELLERLQLKAQFPASEQSTFFSHSSFQFDKQNNAVHRARDDSMLDMLCGESFHTSPLPAAEDTLFTLGFVSPASTPPRQDLAQIDCSLSQFQLACQHEERSLHGHDEKREEVEQGEKADNARSSSYCSHVNTPRNPLKDTDAARLAEVNSESVEETSQGSSSGEHLSIEKTLKSLVQPNIVSPSFDEISNIDDELKIEPQHSHDDAKTNRPSCLQAPGVSPLCLRPKPKSHLALQCSGTQAPNAKVTLWMPHRAPPSVECLLASALLYGVPIAVHTSAFYSKPEDVTASRHVGHNQLFVPSSAIIDELEFDTNNTDKVGSVLHQWRLQLNISNDFSLQLAEQLSLEHIHLTGGSNRSSAVLQWAEQRAALVPRRKCLIIPSRLPPGLEKALQWLKEEQIKSEKKLLGKSNILTTKQQEGLNEDLAKVMNVEKGGTNGDKSVSTCEDVPKLPHGQSVTSAADNLSLPVTPTLLSTFTPSPLKPTAHSTPAPVVSPDSESSLTGIVFTPTLTKKTTGTHATSYPSAKPGAFKWSPEQSLITPIGKRRHSVGFSQLDGPTPKNTYGFRVTQLPSTKARSAHECQHLTILSVELHMRTRGHLLPDPELDPVCGVFYCVHRDVPDSMEPKIIRGVLLLDDTMSKSDDVQMHFGMVTNHLEVFNNETMLFESLVGLVQRLDPDILVGYEVQKASWGYLLQRAQALKFDLLAELSRVVEAPRQVPSDADNPAEEYNARHTSELHIPGRVILNVWRIMRHEVTLNVYSFENVVFHVLHLRLPHYSHHALSHWFGHQPVLNRYRVVDYYQARAYYTLQLLTKLDLISRTSELARLFGIQFYDVLSRGSQFRVESMMLRLAKPANYVAVSPSVEQRARMNAPECIPLVMEPESRFYTDPVVVLDFQSLYPSIIIAHNYCFSTCLGRVSQLSQDGQFKFGCTSLSVPANELKGLECDVSISPNGVVFVKECVRRGILPVMLEEILNTRIMVKQAMKESKGNKVLHRMLDHRQLGLKLIANVTYGYTSANFSGRMPCIEIADSIVRKARETLERAIHLVSTTQRWGAHVVYGDTDSMFILLEGSSKERAFKIGQEIVDAVTAANPKPIKLKFEKVYYPCVLQTKKRYVGYKYETPDQAEPVFEAKGIETVRRDSCPAVSKTLERTLKFLFDSRDVSQCKAFVQRQCSKVLEGRVSMQDLIFAKEYRGRSSYQPGACVPCLEITKRLLAVDRRAEPLVGERVPYVVVCGLPGQPLIQLVRRPEDVLEDHSLRLNAVYYITKQILPPLQRVFSLLGVDVFSWYEDLPRTVRTRGMYQQEQVTGKASIAQYFTSLHCPVCHELTHRGICTGCHDNHQRTVAVLNERLRSFEAKYHMLCELCFSCSGGFSSDISCTSHDCPVFFRRIQAKEDLLTSSVLRDTYLI